MFYYHHKIWAEFSRLCIIPTLLFTLYRFLTAPSVKSGGWSQYHVREKYSTWYESFHPLRWDYWNAKPLTQKEKQ